MNRKILTLMLLLTIGGVEADTRDSVEQWLQRAEAKRQEAAQLGFEWSYTEDMILQAKAALQRGDRQKAQVLAKQAFNQSLNAVRQAQYADEHWQQLLPQ